jgi:hypothetical protein
MGQVRISLRSMVWAGFERLSTPAGLANREELVIGD